jgi:hypothetical protein
MEPRTKRTLVGCGAGCGALVLLLVGGCIGFSTWLRAPGALLEPQRLLDPEAVGYVETRLDLDNPGTAALVSAAVELMEAQEPPVDFPLARVFFRWNVARQERELRRAFPARVVWTVYPGAVAPTTESVASFSIQRAGHQLLLADWIFEWVLGRAPAEASLEHGRERVLVVREDSGDDDRDGETLQLEPPGEPGETHLAPAAETPGVFYVFLRGEGAFFATGERAVRRAIDLLDRPEVRDGWEPSRLGALVAALPEDRQLRGAMLNPNGELPALLEPLLRADGGLANEEQRAAWRSALEGVEAATVAGGFEPSGDAVLDVELQAPPERRAALLEAVRQALAATGDEVDLDRDARETGRGVTARLVLRDVPAVVRQALEERGGSFLTPARGGAEP